MIANECFASEKNATSPLELMVTLGLDSRLAYQNAASKALMVRPKGSSLLGVTDFFNAEEIRDRVFSGRTVRYVNEEIWIGQQRIWVTRTYHPLIDDDGLIMGILSLGTSFRKAAAAKTDTLSQLKRLALNVGRWRVVDNEG